MDNWVKSKTQSIWAKIKLKKYLYGFWCLIVLLFVPTTIWLAYYLGDCGYVLIKTSLSVGDALGFWGAFLTFLGTAGLGALAIWQNHKIQNLNNEKEEANKFRDNEKIRLQCMPQFMIQSADPDKWMNRHYILPTELRDTHTAMVRFKSFIFMYREDLKEWAPINLYPVMENGYEDRVFSIVNCGNNTAHQVKFYILIGNDRYVCEKAASILKDDEIYFYVSVGRAIVFDAILCIRYFDSFQNVYEQRFSITDNEGVINIVSYTNATLVERNESMRIQDP